MPGRERVITPEPPLAAPMTSSQHVYEVRPRKDHRGVDLISDALPFARLWYGEPDAISYAIGYEKFFSRDRKSTRLNSSHEWISYAVFCLKKKIGRRRASPPRPHTVRQL